MHICRCKISRAGVKISLPMLIMKQVAGLLDELHVVLAVPARGHSHTNTSLMNRGLQGCLMNCMFCLQLLPQGIAAAQGHSHTHTLLTNKGPAWLLPELYVVLAAAAQGHSQVEWLLDKVHVVLAAAA